MKTVKLTIRISEDLRDRIRKMAYRPVVKVSINQFVTSAIEAHIKKKVGKI